MYGLMGFRDTLDVGTRLQAIRRVPRTDRLTNGRQNYDGLDPAGRI